MQTFEEKLLYTVKKDDLKSFKSMMREANLGNLRMGRFPVLSLLYLYGSRKILSAYETGFLKISTWEGVGEPIEISQVFAKKAGKCLRLYFDEIVSPLEMLLILDRTRRVKKAYPVVKPSEAVRKRLKSIYSIKYALNVSYRGTDIVLDRRPLTRREKRRLALACIGCLLILAIVIATPVTVAAMLPDFDAGEVTKLKHIDFSSRETYTVLKDIVIPDGYTVPTVNCSFKGGGGRLLFGKGATLGQFNGRLEDIEICTKGSPIFNACTNISSLENVTVNVDADVEASSDTAFVAVASAATFKNVKVSVRGLVRAVAGEVSSESATGMSMGGIVAQNMYAGNGAGRVYGTLENCSVNFEDLRLEGELDANASFGGLVGENYGIVLGCSVTGAVEAHTVDLGGACYFNGYELTDVTCEATLTQVAEDAKWTSVVGGVAIENMGNMEGCVSACDISVTSAGDAICGGIAAQQSSGTIAFCASSGKLSVKCEGDATCGGVLGRSLIGVDEARQSYYVGFVSKCLSTCTLAVTSGGDASYAGGICGKQEQHYIMTPVYDADGNVKQDADGKDVTEEMYFAGPVTECVFSGVVSGNFDYLGSIIGGCGKKIYDQSFYYLDGKKQLVFDGNVYVSGGQHAFGALYEDESIDKEVSDKGAKDMAQDDIEASDLYKEIMTRLSLEA